MKIKLRGVLSFGCLGLASFFAFACESGGEESARNEGVFCGHSGECEVTETQDTLNFLPEPFETLVVGKNNCYMIQAYFPKHKLSSLLPDRLTIPRDDIMAEYYPDTELKRNEHPFMMSFCHGSDIHDVQTKRRVPDQEELMFLFPVMYEHDDGRKYLCSYSPVLYLDSFLGVVGGLIYGLRKEFHPKMKHSETTNVSGWWRLKGIIEASFETQPGGELAEMPNFYAQTFENPFVTLSYPLPRRKMVFYQSTVEPGETQVASEKFYWNYKGTRVRKSDSTKSVYANYSFSMSWPMNAKQFFN